MSDSTLPILPLENKLSENLFSYFASKFNENNHADKVELCNKLAESVVINSENKPKFIFKETEDTTNPYEIIEIFGDLSSAKKIFNIECNSNRENGNIFNYYFLKIASGNIREALDEAADKNELTPRLINAAAFVSRNYFLEIVEKYANYLLSKHLYYQASYYFMICNKVDTALKTLVENGNFCDAIFLARTRFPENDIFTKQLIHSCIEKLDSKSHFCEEALWLIVLNQPLLAAEKLALTEDPINLKTAADLCSKFGLTNESEAFAFSCFKAALTNGKWLIAQSIVEKYTTLKIYQILVILIQNIHNFKKNISQNYGITEDLFSSQVIKETKIWKGFTIDGQSFITYMYNLLISKELLDSSKSQNVLDALNLLQKEKYNLNSYSEVFYITSCHIAKCFLYLSLNKIEMSYNCILNAFHSNQNFDELRKIVCLLFLPLDILWLEDKSTFLVQWLCTHTNAENRLNFHLEKYIMTKCNFKFDKSDITLQTELGLDLSDIKKNVLSLFENDDVDDSFIPYFGLSIVENLLEPKILENMKIICKETVINNEFTLLSEASFINNKNNALVNKKIEIDATSENLIGDKCAEKFEQEKLNISERKNENSHLNENKTDLTSVDELTKIALADTDEKSKENQDMNLIHLELENEVINRNLKILPQKDDSLVKENLNKLSINDDISFSENALEDPKSLPEVTCIPKELAKESMETITQIIDELIVTVCLNPDKEKSLDTKVSSSQIHEECIKPLNCFFKLINHVISWICQNQFYIKYYLKENKHQITTNNLSSSIEIEKDNADEILTYANDKDLNNENSKPIKEYENVESENLQMYLKDKFDIHNLNILEAKSKFNLTPMEVATKIIKVLKEIMAKNSCNKLREKIIVHIDLLVEWENHFKKPLISDQCD